MEAPTNFFYHNVCHICKLKLTTIKKCSGCRLISYCSQNHQKEDWKYHKSLCLCVRNILKEHNLKSLFLTPSNNAHEWKRNSLSIMCAVELKLKRPLMNVEKQMFFFPNICPVCFIFNFDGNHTCEYCQCVVYCSKEHQNQHFEKHEVDCSVYKICYEIDKLCFESHFNSVNFDVPHCNCLIFPCSMEVFINEYFSKFSDFSKIVLSEHYSGALSLLYAIDSSKYICGKNELNIHIAGASDYEQSVLMTIEILFHRFSHLNKLNLALIGPEMCADYLEPVLCDECKNTKKLTVYKEKNFYHQYNKHSAYMHPDVIISYNCGFSEGMNPDKDTWQETIKDIWNLKQVLLAFTSYTELEAKADLSVFMNKKPEMTSFSNLFFSQNPFKSLRPYRNWEYFESPFFYNNYFINIIELQN